MDSYSNVTRIKARLGRAVRQHHLYWRYVENCRPWLEYRLFDHASVAPVVRMLVTQLRRDGVAITTARGLFGNTILFDDLAAEVRKLEQQKAKEIQDARERKDDKGFKAYLVELLGSHPVLEPESIFVRIAIAPEVLNVAKGYFGMMTRLRFFNVWRNFAGSAPPRNSQLWHRDPEDRFILKMFIYLSDVDDDAGPLFYARGTHGYGKIKAEPELYGEEGTTARRVDDSGMNAVVEKDKWLKAVGPKGTIVFVDTRGYHKGGLARTHERIVYNCMFTSQGSTRGDYFERKGVMQPNSDRAASFALGVNSHS
jgi:hypothetical protein